MDGDQFDALVRRLQRTASRRGIVTLGTVAASAFATIGPRDIDQATARSPFFKTFPMPINDKIGHGVYARGTSPMTLTMD